MNDFQSHEFEPVRYADGGGLPAHYEAIHQTVEHMKRAIDQGDSEEVTRLINQIPVAGEQTEIQMPELPTTIQGREIELLFDSTISRRVLPGLLDREDAALERAAHKR